MSDSKPVIAVAIYTTYGHIKKLADALIKGIESTGATVKPFVFEETLSAEVLEKMHAGPKPDWPVITPDDLKSVDGFVIGAPTRYGRVPAQVSTFFDKTGGLWASGALVGMPVTQFTSTGSQHGGSEATVLTTMPYYIHQGMIFVPPGYQDSGLHNHSEVHGGSPYGTSTIASGDGHLQPTSVDLGAAETQGKYFANVTAALKKGRQ
ncbi:putative cytoplasm protein [Kockovaella imperatae]|uniref:Putative cytoplasm protein n=1 Tax=Kockovaella imperatae TaxID=4999 RepID=A0A1Y1U8D4_9TREE|nr:putative cytoplasm protein [Kockovaella imperatae]ORX33757.1 putative cytoplasm protein [Kockovaella imperatae]